jgi:hypothetical protein
MQKCWHSCFVLFAHKVGIDVVKKLLSIGNNCAIDQSVYMQKKIFWSIRLEPEEPLYIIKCSARIMIL